MCVIFMLFKNIRFGIFISQWVLKLYKSNSEVFTFMNKKNIASFLGATLLGLGVNAQSENSQQQIQQQPRYTMPLFTYDPQFESPNHPRYEYAGSLESLQKAQSSSFPLTRSEEIRDLVYGLNDTLPFSVPLPRMFGHSLGVSSQPFTTKFEDGNTSFSTNGRVHLDRVSLEYRSNSSFTNVFVDSLRAEAKIFDPTNVRVRARRELVPHAHAVLDYNSRSGESRASIQYTRGF